MEQEWQSSKLARGLAAAGSSMLAIQPTFAHLVCAFLPPGSRKYGIGGARYTPEKYGMCFESQGLLVRSEHAMLPYIQESSRFPDYCHSIVCNYNLKAKLVGGGNRICRTLYNSYSSYNSSIL